MDQFGRMVGAKITVDALAFDDMSYAGPTEVFYHGPTSFTAISGRPYYQGPASWECHWTAAVLDDFQALYTAWNLKLNTPSGPVVAFGITDPRNAGTLETADCWMSEPQFKISELFTRDIVVTFTEALPE
jgi:hypothetical protein